MSEKIFACLMRLYPARFRERYGAEMLELFRERRRDEQGIARGFRFWFDLALDFALGLPQAYRNSYALAGASPAPQGADRLPAFRVLEEEPLRPESVFIGSVLAIAALAAFVFVMNHAAGYHPFAKPHGMGHQSTGQPTGNVEQVAEKLDEEIHTAGAVQHCGFEKLEEHPGNIGYVKLNWFADPGQCSQIVQAVMTRLNDTNAIIFDLRDNHGGFPQTVRSIADWLFEQPTPWYNPRASSPEMTHSPVPESRLAKKPVFVLTSWRTFSAGEHFAYDLKTLKRATIIGEKTSGASHGNGPPPEGAKPVWEGKGVEPDVKVKADNALQTAERMALKELARQ